MKFWNCLLVMSFLMLFLVGVVPKSVQASQPSQKQEANNSGDRESYTMEIEADSESKEDIRKAIYAALPKPAEGYEWALFQGVAMLRPIGWYEISKGGTYCTSVESVRDKGSFETGATIQVIRNIKKKYGVSPLVITSKMVNDIKLNNDNKRLILTTNSNGKTATVVYRYRNAPKGSKPIIVHKYYMISDQEDSVNIITFESNEQEWENYWNKHGKIILGQIGTIPFF